MNAVADQPELRSLEITPQLLTITWLDGSRSEYPSLWLRDNCPADRSEANGQRLVDIADIPTTPRLASASIKAGVLELQWRGEERVARFELGWLAAHAPGRVRRRPGAFRLWRDGARLDARRDFAWGQADVLRADARLRERWLARLVGDGLAFLEQVPSRHHEILRALDFAGRVVDTNYGLVFDVRSVSQPENLAYSDLGLGLHTDNPYREPVPGYQALHCLIASPEGGDNLFADGFAIAAHLRDTEPEHFRRLTSTLVPFRYRSRDAELASDRPLIELDASGEVVAVSYNNRSIAPLSLPPAEMDSFYAAYRALALALREPRFALRTKLAAGELVVFDNRRTLHGRTAYSSARHERHLQGCYLSRESVLSSLGVLERAAAGAG
jgi:alpha-ketoglutarate-dependent taurine dioxygenase